jgi:hypothetical protein
MRTTLAALLLLPALASAADNPCVSGPRVGQRPGPYSFVLCTGEQRGKSHCYICDTADKPAVIVFARTISEPLGKLAAGLDKALVEYRKNDLRVWVTLLHDEQSKLDPDVLKWARKHALKNTPVGVFEDTDGPPSYKLHKDADITVLLCVKQKVVANFAFRSGEMKAEQIKTILDTIPRVAGAAKK